MRVLEPEPEMTVQTIVDALARKSITINAEYQRGRAWKPDQQKVLLDSVLRGYPLPRFYFSLDKSTDPLGNRTTSMQVIDGLQRLLALSEFFQDKWPLFDPAVVPIGSRRRSRPLPARGADCATPTSLRSSRHSYPAPGFRSSSSSSSNRWTSFAIFSSACRRHRPDTPADP